MWVSRKNDLSRKRVFLPLLLLSALELNVYISPAFRTHTHTHARTQLFGMIDATVVLL
jgi:hypothetical protein